MRLYLFHLVLAAAIFSQVQTLHSKVTDAGYNLGKAWDRGPAEPKEISDVTAKHDPPAILKLALEKIQGVGDYQQAAKAYLLATTYTAFDRARTDSKFHPPTVAISLDFIRALSDEEAILLDAEVVKILKSEETKSWINKLGPPKYWPYYMGEPVVEPGFPSQTIWEQLFREVFEDKRPK